MYRYVHSTLLLGAFGLVLHSAQAQTSDTTQFAVGRAAMEKNDLDAAIPAFERAVKANDANPVYHYWLGNAYGGKAQSGNFFVKMKYAPRMRDEWERSVVLDPSSYEARGNLYLFYTQAPAIAGGNPEKARAEREAMLRLRPYSAALYFTNVDMRAQRYDDVVAYMRPLLSAYPDSVAIPVALADAQADAKRYGDAWTTIDAARRRFPADPQLNYAVGRTASISGIRLAEGMTALEQYLAHPASPKSPLIAGAHYRIGMILERQGNKAAAKTEYAEAIRLDPTNVRAKMALDHLGS